MDDPALFHLAGTSLNDTFHRKCSFNPTMAGNFSAQWWRSFIPYPQHVNRRIMAPEGRL